MGSKFDRTIGIAGIVVPLITWLVDRLYIDRYLKGDYYLSDYIDSKSLVNPVDEAPSEEGP